ncbi:hypothetical protein RHMOL_Rhmol09G0019500 [Rhododendron molle]|uniref:Uncharacterized protein n=1 Tax=Rhododendron molle TaxID=49168 RepID=A0ACC0M8R3_RHOML|nr:hypothetical protein RHMOL_Rhmol09G0019500 [Rhododendron molle]
MKKAGSTSSAPFWPIVEESEPHLVRNTQNTSMVSPRAGRGIGTRTSPRKGVVKSLQLSNRNVNDRAKWTPSLTRCLLEACAEESDEHGRALNGFSYQGWQRIVWAFAMKTGTVTYKKEQLKNKHDRLKDEWKAWILVAEDTSQTGLGRDPDTGAITGPEHWWAAMIAGVIVDVQRAHLPPRRFQAQSQTTLG